MTKDTRDYLLGMIRTAEDHLAQYRAYAQVMRIDGRGIYLSSPYSEDALVAQLTEAKRLIAAEAQ